MKFDDNQSKIREMELLMMISAIALPISDAIKPLALILCEVVPSVELNPSSGVDEEDVRIGCGKGGMSVHEDVVATGHPPACNTRIGVSLNDHFFPLTKFAVDELVCIVLIA